MNVRIAYVLFICLLCGNNVFSQISYGGVPLFLENSPLKSSALLDQAKNPDFIDMPSFDLDSIRRLDAINEGNMRGSFSFAHKFYTRIERG
ncbi:MAG: hypothetical protein LBB85_02295, partial [Dysgonamonadaceae bacterium]|nr:hypothetical protein [Dysgonamonadaceae bacterium]